MPYRKRRESLRANPFRVGVQSVLVRSIDAISSASAEDLGSRSACSAARWRRWRCSAIPTSR